jgi:hypothetical protein
LFSSTEVLPAEEGAMAQDVVALLDDFISADDPAKWAKLASTVNSRRLELLLLREILIELRKISQAKPMRSAK